MPVFEFYCPKCNQKTEMLLKNEKSLPVCKKCGAEMQRVYSGKMYGATGAKNGGGCTGNCSTCSGCK